MKTYIKIILCIFIIKSIFLLNSCSDNPAKLNLKIYSPCNQQDNLQNVSYFTFEALDANNKEQVSYSIFEKKNNSGEIKGFSNGELLYFNVKGYELNPKTNPESKPISIGSTGPVQITSCKDTKIIPVMISSVESIAKTTKAGTNDCSEMNFKRVGHTATTLLNGKVLIAGGLKVKENEETVEEAVTNTTEIYDPTTGEFNAGPNMVQPRAFHTATLIESTGEVLIAGGLGTIDGKFNSHVSLEVLNPSTNEYKFIKEKFLPRGRAYHSAIYINDLDYVVFSGGIDIQDLEHLEEPQEVFIEFIEVFDVKSQTFIKRSTLNKARANHTSTLVRVSEDDSDYSYYIILIGGKSEEGILKSIEIFDVKNDKLLEKEYKMEIPRVYHSVNFIGQNRILIAGGENGTITREPVKEIELLDLSDLEHPERGIVAELTNQRSGHMSFFNGSAVYIIGGRGIGNLLVDGVEKISIGDSIDDIKWEEAGDGAVKLSKARYNSASAIIGESFLMIGGQTKGKLYDFTSDALSSAEVFVPIIQ